jgi:uncharacterized PurR-regulated membrane protein YhhQ (DUF165 family)
MARRAIGITAFLAYAASVAGANWATDHYDPVPVGFGLTATAGTYAVGAALLLRDFVQDAFGRSAAGAAVLTGAALSAVTSPSLALASASAFVISELSDFGVYTPLRERGWVRAVVVSNAVGAVLDTLVFLLVAGLPLTMLTSVGQLVGKTWATAVVIVAVLAVRRTRRVVLRYSLGA